MGQIFSKHSAPEPRLPPAVETDLVVPFHYWDDLAVPKAICMDYTFKFDDVLDIEKLRSALKKLLELPGWKKLGARTRTNKSGKFEYHIPQKYDAKRPGFILTRSIHHVPQCDHPLASTLPSEGERISLFGAPKEFSSLFRDAAAPTGLDDWLFSDMPQMHIHAVSFSDTTFVTFTFMHSLMDAMGIASLLVALTAVLRGREDSIPEFSGFDDDPLLSLTDTPPKETYYLLDKMITGWSSLFFGLRFMLETWWHPLETKTIFIPGKLVNDLRSEALQDLDPDKKEFISEGDVIFSWWSRILLQAMRPASNRTVMLINVFDVRPILATCNAISRGSVLLTNAIFSATTLIPGHLALQKPLGYVASQLRTTLNRQRNIEQVKALVSLQKLQLETTGHGGLFGDYSMFTTICSNWTKARFFEVDFSSAVLESTQPANKIGRPSYINFVAHRAGGIIALNGGVIVGKTIDGDWWAWWTTRRSAWPRIQRCLERFHTS